ncbi:MAG: recJ: single-stranded-DNA-specific exonuclease RecJ [Firmicutes bacterium]|nr:recJ: single-stranded-DNA-specific exonuclease RecJ [Bacillota bacterium]
MGPLKKKWKLSPAKFDIQQQLSSQLGIPRPIAQVLINRGLEQVDEARDFLCSDVGKLWDPYLLKGMDFAVKRIRQAVDGKEKIIIYGDYDVDGMTSTATLYKLLSCLGACVDYYIPERLSEGYGLNALALEQLYQSGAQLILSVDCGISSVSEVAQFFGKLDFIITDHHQPPAQLPLATAIINPKQIDCTYPEKNLAGVGIAFKLCQALWPDFRQEPLPMDDYLELAAIGTIADIVSLTGENRIIVKNGLQKLNRTQNIGLQALLLRCGLSPGTVDSGKVGFVIAPRLNAAGRVGNASNGVELLVTTDQERAAVLAGQLDEENLLRQATEKEIFAAAEEMLAKQEEEWKNVFVLAGSDWHPGVIGIVASRLVSKYYRPVVMISVQDGEGRGSCRSIPGFDIVHALSECSGLLLKFGGHKQAAGLSIVENNIDEFRAQLNKIAKNALSPEDYIPVLKIDSFVGIEEIDESFLQKMDSLAPHGMGNPSPLFVCKKTAVASAKAIGKEKKHLKLKVRHNEIAREVIAWNMGERAAELTVNDPIYIAFSPAFNEWQGRRDIQFKAEDVFKPEFEEKADQALDDIAPDRDVITTVYCVCREHAVRNKNIDISFSNLVNLVRHQYKGKIGERSIQLSMEILQELDFLSIEKAGEDHRVSFLPHASERRDLFSSLIYRKSLKMREDYISKEIFQRGSQNETEC